MCIVRVHEGLPSLAYLITHVFTLLDVIHGECKLGAELQKRKYLGPWALGQILHYSNYNFYATISVL
jgi:hypothetical protein